MAKRIRDILKRELPKDHIKIYKEGSLYSVYFEKRGDMELASIVRPDLHGQKEVPVKTSTTTASTASFHRQAAKP